MDYENNNHVFSFLEQMFGTDALVKEMAENPMFAAMFPPHKGFHRDTKAMDSTPPADVIEHPDAYVFMVDMPGLKSGDIKVQVEEEKKDNVLVISGERKREEEKNKEAVADADGYVMKKFMRRDEEEEEEEKEKVKYVKMERRVNFMRKFVLAENANTDSISAVSEDGVLTVTVNKLSLSPQPKMPKTIQVKKIAS